MDDQPRAFCALADETARSMASVRALVKSVRDSPAGLDTAAGISLLGLKHHVLLGYLRALVLLTARRALGHSLAARAPPVLPFSSPARAARGAYAGDLVDGLVEGRVVLEKIKTLEGRMRYQIEKLVRGAEVGSVVVDDPLAFRPNPQNLVDGPEDQDNGSDVREDDDGIYHPPRVAATPYITAPSSKKTRRRAVPSGLSALREGDPTLPTTESSTGLGGVGSVGTTRARELARLTAFEEENMMRVVMKKKEAKRRARDEEDVALGGGGMGRGRGGLAEEIGEVLRSVGRGGAGDGYEELRVQGRKGGVLRRSRVRDREEAFGEENIVGSRFEKERKAAGKKARRR